MEAEGETLAKRSSLDQDETEESSQDPDAKTLKEGALQGCGISVAGGSNGKDSKVSENGGVGEGGSSKEVFVEESEMNGASMLMKMQQSGGGEGSRGLDSVLDAINSDGGSGDEMKGAEQEVNDRSSDAKEWDQDGETAVDTKEGDQQSGGGEGLRGLDSVLDAINSDDGSGDERKGTEQEVNGHSSDAKEGDRDGETVGFSLGGGDDDIGDESREFSEGDFVWGKVKSHPWWPGRVYDPSNASDHANKVKQGDKTLVAYFGDSTFAWCNPSQLKPLDEDFVEMSKQSRSRNFVKGVSGLLDEVAMLVDLKMTCSCVPKESLTGIDRAIAVNDGIKEEVLVPEGGLEKFPAQFFEPSNCLSMLKDFAKTSGVDNMLKVTVLKSFLSAFYHANGGCQLPAYHDPQPIPGLEDETGEGENGTLGLAEDDAPCAPVGPESQTSTQRVLQKCQEVPEDRLYQRRKQKSIAEIIGQTTDAKTETRDDDTAKKQTTSGKKTSKAERKKRKDEGEGADADAKSKDDVKDSAEGSLSGRKKKKVGEDDGGEASRGNPTSVPRKSKRKSTDEGLVIESTLSSKLKKNKAAKLPESNEAADNTVSCVVKDDSEVQKSRSEKKSKKRETSDAENGGSAEEKGKNMGGSQEERAANELTGDRRERKKSKYLSFPYVTVNKEQKKEEIEAESVKISSEAQPGKSMTRFDSNLSVSPGVESRDGKPHTKTAKEHGRDHEASASGPRKPKQGKKKIYDACNVEAPAVEVLSRLRSAARDPLHVEGDNSLDKVDGFLSDFRKSITLDGSKDKMYGQKQEGKRRISKKSGPTLSNMKQGLAESSSPNVKSRLSKIMKKKDANSDISKEKEAADANTTDEGTAVLLVSFNPASALPTKDELIKTYKKYGALRLEDADMYDQKRFARIMFSKDSEAEKAFNDSQIVSPFPKAKVTFRLQYLSNERKTRELKEVSGAKLSLANKTGNPPAEPTAPELTNLPASEMSQLVYVKGKLVGIAAMLENPDGKISENLKSKLQSEVNDALEKMSAMVGPSP